MATEPPAEVGRAGTHLRFILLHLTLSKFLARLEAAGKTAEVPTDKSNEVTAVAVLAVEEIGRQV
jgi:hypothetical protein